MRRALRPPRPAVLAALLGAGAAQTYEARFDVAWRLVDERYWDLSALSVDWDEARERYADAARDAADDETFFALLEAMYDEIGDDHSVFVPPARVEEIRRTLRRPPLPRRVRHGRRRRRRGGPPRAAGARGPIGYALLDDAVGYLRIADLVSAGPPRACATPSCGLLSLGADAFVLDLRGNPGGRLVTMMQVAGVFTRGFLWRTITTWSLPIPYPAIGLPATEAPLAILVDATSTAPERVSRVPAAPGARDRGRDHDGRQRGGGAALLPPRRLAGLDRHRRARPHRRAHVGGTRRRPRRRGDRP
jgi:carboxyl-terminal processing protease